MKATSVKNILISVIVPIYNVEKYLHKCIDSILDQEIPLEIILIDDGSTDQSGKIIDAYHKTNKNIKVIHQKNQGLAATRNRGLQVATGEYIVFVDSDDWLIKDSLIILYNAAKKNKVDIIMGNVIFYDNKDEKIHSPFNKIEKPKHDIIFTGEEGYIELMKNEACPPMVFNYIYKRKWLIQNTFQFQDLLHEDELWTPVVLCQAKKMLILDCDFYCYRNREGSIMKTINPRRRVSSLFTICDLLIQFTNLVYEKKPILFSWLYVRIYHLYRIAFNTLPKLQDSTYKLPSHHLYAIYQIYYKLEKETRQICKQNYLIAKKELRKYLKLQISPWFTTRKPDKTKTLILIYNTMWDEPLPLQPKDVPESYVITTDRYYFSEADAVVFHIPTLFSELADDLCKREGQIWIAWSLECEANYPIWKNNEFMSIFDLQMSYHQYADIVYPYYRSNDLKTMYDSIPLSGKINKCCMFISSSFNLSNRIEFINELMKYTAIDSYGKLFNNSIITNDRGRESKLEVYAKYKFVIAFENSIGYDYVTEKFFDPLLAGTVPIYFGAPNIEEYTPGDNCFINATMFKNPLDLAHFINRCYEDEVIYSQFFNWKKQSLSASFLNKVEKQKINPFIVLCNKVKEKKQEILQNERTIATLGNIYLCSFADSRYTKSLERLESQADNIGLFKDIYIYSEQDLDDSFQYFFRNQLSHKVRGFGYWVWKPYLIYQCLQKIDENDVLLYVDAGCHLNYRGEKRFINYWKIVKNNETGFLVSQLEADKLERKWTKGDVLDFFEVRNKSEVTDTPQYQAGIIFIRKNRHTVNVIKEWLSVFYSNFHLADETPSLSFNMDGYIAHRHDQSLLSILLKKHGTSTLPLEEVYTSSSWEYLESFAPILIRRDLN